MYFHIYNDPGDQLWLAQVLDSYSFSQQPTKVSKYTFHISKEGWPVWLKGELHWFYTLNVSL